jgi:hypothetical protein
VEIQYQSFFCITALSNIEKKFNPLGSVMFLHALDALWLFHQCGRNRIILMRQMSEPHHFYAKGAGTASF